MYPLQKYLFKRWNSAAMGSDAPIPDFVSAFLVKVHRTLQYSLLCALYGASLHLHLDVGGWITAFGFIGSLCWMCSINPSKEIQRVVLFMAAASFFGATVGPLIKLFLEMNQRDIIKIIMRGTLVCTCEYGASIYNLDKRYHNRLVATPVMTAWLIIYGNYPDLLAQTLLVLLLPYPLTFVRDLLDAIRILMLLRFVLLFFGFGGHFFRGDVLVLLLLLDLPLHVAWIALLCYFLNYPILYILYEYMLFLGLLWSMTIYTEETIYLAIHHTDQIYYVNTAITFFTEFIARMVALILRIVTIVTRK